MVRSPLTDAFMPLTTFSSHGILKLGSPSRGKHRNSVVMSCAWYEQSGFPNIYTKLYRIVPLKDVRSDPWAECCGASLPELCTSTGIERTDEHADCRNIS